MKINGPSELYFNISQIKTTIDIINDIFNIHSFPIEISIDSVLNEIKMLVIKECSTLDNNDIDWYNTVFGELMHRYISSYSFKADSTITLLNDIIAIINMYKDKNNRFMTCYNYASLKLKTYIGKWDIDLTTANIEDYAKTDDGIKLIELSEVLSKLNVSLSRSISDAVEYILSNGNKSRLTNRIIDIVYNYGEVAKIVIKSNNIFQEFVESMINNEENIIKKLTKVSNSESEDKINGNI